MLGQLGLGRVEGGPDHRAHHLAPEPVRHPDHDRLGHRRVAQQHGLDLARVDVLPAPDDHLLEPARDPAVAALVHRPQVAGVQPAVGVDRRGGGLRVAQVAVHDEVAAGADLADGPARARSSAGARVDDLHLGLRQRPPQRSRPGRRACRMAGVIVIEQLDSVCANVSTNGTPERGLDLPHQLRRDGRAAGHREPQADRSRGARAGPPRAARSASSARPRRRCRGTSR